MKLLFGVNCLIFVMFEVPECSIEGKINQQFNFWKSQVQNIYNKAHHEYVADQIDFDKLLHILLLLLCLEKYALSGKKFKQYKEYLERKRGVNVRRMEGRKRSYLLLLKYAETNAIQQCLQRHTYVKDRKIVCRFIF